MTGRNVGAGNAASIGEWSARAIEAVIAAGIAESSRCNIPAGDPARIRGSTRGDVAARVAAGIGKLTGGNIDTVVGSDGTAAGIGLGSNRDITAVRAPASRGGGITDCGVGAAGAAGVGGKSDRGVDADGGGRAATGIGAISERRVRSAG